MTGFEIFMVLATILSAATAAYGQYQQGQTKKQAAEYNAAMARNQAAQAEYEAEQEARMAEEQAKWAEYNAAAAEKEAEIDASKQREATRRLVASQAARYGASGVTLEGTPLEVMSATALEGEYDSLLIEHQGAMEAWNYREQARQARSQGSAALIEGANTASVYRSFAGLNLLKGQQASRAGIYEAGGSLLTGAERAGSRYYTYTQTKTKTKP